MPINTFAAKLPGLTGILITKTSVPTFYVLYENIVSKSYKTVVWMWHYSQKHCQKPKAGEERKITKAKANKWLDLFRDYFQRHPSSPTLLKNKSYIYIYTHSTQKQKQISINEKELTKPWWTQLRWTSFRQKLCFTFTNDFPPTFLVSQTL